jgi:hypothetical protein
VKEKSPAGNKDAAAANSARIFDDVFMNGYIPDLNYVFRRFQNFTRRPVGNCGRSAYKELILKV